MPICSNCGTEFDYDTKDSVRIMHGIEDDGHNPAGKMSAYAAGLCPECLSGAKVIKLVLKRNLAGQFAYEQFSVLEMENRAFGK